MANWWFGGNQQQQQGGQPAGPAGPFNMNDFAHAIGGAMYQNTQAIGALAQAIGQTAAQTGSGAGSERDSGFKSLK